MAEQSLREFAQQQLECAKKIVRQGKELMPVLVMETDGAPVVAGFPEYGDGPKSLQRLMMQDLLREKNAERYCFVMEAWFGSPPAPNDQDYRPSKDPKRMEAIAVSAQSIDGEKVFLICEIKRGKGGLVQFDEKNPDLGGSPVGPLGDLFGKDTRQ